MKKLIVFLYALGSVCFVSAANATPMYPILLSDGRYIEAAALRKQPQYDFAPFDEHVYSETAYTSAGASQQSELYPELFTAVGHAGVECLPYHTSSAESLFAVEFQTNFPSVWSLDLDYIGAYGGEAHWLLSRTDTSELIFQTWESGIHTLRIEPGSYALESIAVAFGDIGTAGYSFEFRLIPEPSTMILIGTGVIGLAGFRRKFGKN